MSALAATPFLAWVGGWKAEAVLAAARSFPQYPGQNLPQNPMGDPTHNPPQFPGDPQPPPGEWPNNNPPLFPPLKVDRRAILLESQKNIRKDVAQLYDLAGKLRKQVEQTDSTEVLSIDMIQTADQIEKLAKQIKDLAKS